MKIPAPASTPTLQIAPKPLLPTHSSPQAMANQALYGNFGLTPAHFQSLPTRPGTANNPTPWNFGLLSGQFQSLPARPETTTIPVPASTPTLQIAPRPVMPTNWFLQAAYGNFGLTPAQFQPSPARPGSANKPTPWNFGLPSAQFQPSPARPGSTNKPTPWINHGLPLMIMRPSSTAVHAQSLAVPTPLATSPSDRATPPFNSNRLTATTFGTAATTKRLPLNSISAKEPAPSSELSSELSVEKLRAASVDTPANMVDTDSIQTPSTNQNAAATDSTAATQDPQGDDENVCTVYNIHF